jgi:hypothetical protein
MTTGFSGRLGEVAQEAVGAEAAADFLIVEYDPAQRLPTVVLAAWQKLSGMLGQIVKDYGGLAELAAGVDEHGRLAHFIDRRTVGGGPGFAVEEIDEYRLPVGAHEIEHQGGPIGVGRTARNNKADSRPSNVLHTRSCDATLYRAHPRCRKAIIKTALGNLPTHDRVLILAA